MSQKPNNIMLDLETFGTSPGSAIIAIGAVRFDENGWYEAFRATIDLQSCIEAGMTVDASTIMWWMCQSDDARRQFERPAVSIEDGLIQFTNWIREPDTIWGNGIDFDNILLAEAYRACRKEVPWQWRKNRCYRTIKGLCAEVPFNRMGVHHDALDDAKDQALHLVACLQSLDRTDLLCDGS